MRQLLQNLKSGELTVAEVPAPPARPGCVLARAKLSLISPGTERMLVDFARSTLVGKALKQPERVQQVLDKVRSEGLLAAYEAVQSRLDEPLPLGYSSVGTVISVGDGVRSLTAGDRVVSSGPHAEIVCVPQHLCARVPDQVTDEQAAFTVLGAIGLQGIRLLAPALGETVAVTGLGLIGLLSVQLLRASGCRVIGIDPDPGRCELAARCGATAVDLSAGIDPVERALALTEGHGVDGVLITAAATKDRIVHQSARMCRRRGRIVLVGVVDLDLNRADFYEKEITFQVSCSYGPGRYDEVYESGQDYPYGLVRWTEQRNFAAVLACLADGRLDPLALIADRVPLAEAQRAYAALAAGRSSLATLITYPEGPAGEEVLRAAAVAAAGGAIPRAAAGATAGGGIPQPAALASGGEAPGAATGQAAPPGGVVLGLIGAGNFTKRTLAPAMKGLPARLKTVVAPDGVAAAEVARRFAFERAAGDIREILDDDEINAVIIATRHDSHAALTVAALRAGKHVWVEKPLCLDRAELDEIRRAHEEAGGRMLHVGFNRRFAPLTNKMRALLRGRTGPLCLNALVNAGALPANAWPQDRRAGGGRMIGEGCHWIDLMRYLTGAPITAVQAAMVGPAAGAEIRDDKIAVTLSFADGSIGTVLYFANGHRAYPKETIEVFGDGRVLRLDNFRRLTGHGWSGLGPQRLLRPRKGHREQLRAFVERVQSGGDALIPFAEIENVTLAAFAAIASAEGAGRIDLPR
jgi:predicted dehydrogenase/threonine dehydrogenase-like Zn-dependent dehydrogenase